MIFVYVKHFLSEKGRIYFDNKWYPYVNERIRRQEGFVSIETSRESSCENCINITVIFEDQEKLMTWVKHQDHQMVINDLDIYRTKGQRWYISNGSVSVPDWELWDEAPLSTNRFCSHTDRPQRRAVLKDA